ncbi:YaiO family outer membrane beta-barrel protein [Allosphingosinicella deserti]|uniref:YaiO beta-barrel domain-containing protein n=1 Tax=Allosphingosinicella deserti TaxID=2116704 RepID=A0A2P7QVW8_9SPHN|nr:YaiO family outer membrane beta-barrel protein [Sphingomonas deserti]PSJ42106.1 hypothetical protein C7I55_07660 [Sphingomonas deserti]
MSYHALVATALLAVPQPAVAQTLAPEQAYEEGVAARTAGDIARAVELLSQVVEAQPANADAHLQLGLALSAAHRDEEAKAALSRTLEIAPDYVDARIALARLAQRRGDLDEARRQVGSISSSNQEVRDLISTLSAGEAALPYRWQLDIDGSYSALGSGRPDWKEATVQLGYNAGPATVIAGRLEGSRRFGFSDVYGELRLDQRLSSDAAIYVSLGGTPDADFRPEWQIGVGGSLRVRRGPAATAVTLDARQARYAAGDIQTVSPGVEQYIFGGRAWISGRWINIFDEAGNHQWGWLGRADVLATEAIRLFAGAADAPDVSEGVVTDTFSLFAGVSAAISQRTTIRLSIAHEDRATGTDRSQVGMGLGIRF